MRRSYASGYARQSRREPSLGWFIIGAVVIGVGYVYISGLGESEVAGEGEKGVGAAEVAGGGGGDSAGAAGAGDIGGETVRTAVPVIDEAGGGPEVGRVWRAGSQMVMAWVPGGSYMVRTDGGVETKEFDSGFWFAVRAVTEAEYEEVMGTNPVPEGKRDPQAPVTRVSWGEGKGFAAKLTASERKDGKLPANYEYRIPGELVWEYALGGGEDGAALRLREDDSRDLTWWRLNGIKEFQDSRQEGALRSGTYDVGAVCEWTLDEVESGQGAVVVRGAPHTAYLGREEEVVKSRYTIFHRDEKLPFLGFRLVLVKTGPDEALAGGSSGQGTGSGAVPVRPLKPGEEVDYVQRTGAFNLEELFEPSRHSRDSALTKYNILRKVQLELQRNGYYTSRVDGYPGKSTQKAIDIFQAAVGLPKTGRLDDVTLESLGLADLKPEGEGGGAGRTASRSEAPERPLPLGVPERPREDSVVPAEPVTEVSPVREGEGERNSEVPPASAPRVSAEDSREVRREQDREEAVPRAVPAVVRNPAPLPRAIPYEAGEASRSGEGGYVEPTRELRYDGFRGKFRQLSDVLAGTYDPAEDRRR